MKVSHPVGSFDPNEEGPHVSKSRLVWALTLIIDEKRNNKTAKRLVFMMKMFDLFE